MSYKYEEIIEFIKKGISDEVLKVGQKLPSLRNISTNFNCAISVAIQGYAELECQGYIKSIEKSGYFVTSHKNEKLPEPQNYKLSLKSFKSKSNFLTNDIISMSNNKNILPLGAAIPDSSILAVNKITNFLIKELKHSPDCLARYTHNSGSPLLKEELCKYMFKRSVNVKIDDIVVTNGCEEALYLAIESSTEEGDTVAIESPVFFSLISILEQLKREVIEIPTSASRGLDLDILEEIIDTNSVKAVVFSSSFQNPLCYSMEDRDKERLYQIASKKDIFLIEDDIFADCSFEGKINRPVKAIDTENRVIYCSSFSKTLAPGIRIGWSIPGKIINKYSNKKNISSLGGSVILQEAIAEYLKSGSYDFHLKYFRKKIMSQTYQIRNLIEKYFPSNIKISKPDGGYFLWIEFDKSINSLKIFDMAINKNIGIVPGPVFSASNNYNNCIRISCGSPVNSEIEDGIKILGEICHNIKQ